MADADFRLDRSIKSPRALWREFKYGRAPDVPAVEDVERRTRAWRAAGGESGYYHDRKFFVDYIQQVVRAEEQALCNANANANANAGGAVAGVDAEGCTGEELALRKIDVEFAAAGGTLHRWRDVIAFKRNVSGAASANSTRKRKARGSDDVSRKRMTFARRDGPRPRDVDDSKQDDDRGRDDDRKRDDDDWDDDDAARQSRSRDEE